MKDIRAWLVGLVISGFMVTLPLLLVALVVVKLYHAVAGLVLPLLESMPGLLFRNTAVRFLIVAIAVGALFLLIGAVAKTRMGRSIGRWFELALLSRLPFYNVLRTLASGLAGREDAGSMQTVLVTMDTPGLQQFGFVVERHADGAFTVFIPSSPNPGSGTVCIVEAARVRELHVPIRKVLQCLGRWGNGAAYIVETGRHVDGEKSGSNSGFQANATDSGGQVS